MESMATLFHVTFILEKDKDSDFQMGLANLVDLSTRFRSNPMGESGLAYTFHRLPPLMLEFPSGIATGNLQIHELI
jgi:hypothetical protein